MCDICLNKKTDSLQLGEFMTKSNIRVHYYCLLLSTNLVQRGTDSGGILGFLLKDIKKEIKDSEKRVCHYCEKRNASIQCNTCLVWFHLICGQDRGCRFEFINEFKSFCHEHHGIVREKVHSEKEVCYICLQAMGKYHPITSITASCCSGNLWMHSNCLKEYAISAGYYLKCIWCRNLKFRDDIRRLGVFVPDRDAKWEQGKEAFQELYQKYSKCDAVNCKCPHGRNSRLWKILVCHTCGASGIHRLCVPASLNGGLYQCDMCISIFTKRASPAAEETKADNSTELLGINAGPSTSKQSEEQQSLPLKSQSPKAQLAMNSKLQPSTSSEPTQFEIYCAKPIEEQIQIYELMKANINRGLILKIGAEIKERRRREAEMAGASAVEGNESKNLGVENECISPVDKRSFPSRRPRCRASKCLDISVPLVGNQSPDLESAKKSQLNYFLNDVQRSYSPSPSSSSD